MDKEIPEFVKGLNVLNYQKEDAPIHEIKTVYGNIKFVLYGETSEFRVRTFFTKEPETLSWIDSFLPDDVFWDIGANIGCYSMYAARKGISVCAFEPSPVNFWLLSMNSTINEFQTLLTFPFALSSEKKMEFWNPSYIPASADNQLNKSRERYSNTGIQVYSVDNLTNSNQIPFPNHIKIDVDGIEPLIIDGANETLSSQALRSVMIEVNEDEEMNVNKIINSLKNKGFSDPIKRHEPYLNKNYYLPMTNYLFRRV